MEVPAAKKARKGDKLKDRRRAAESTSPAQPSPGSSPSGPTPSSATDLEELRWRASLTRTDVKSGPFSQAEKETLKRSLEQFARQRNLSTDDYSWLLLGVGAARDEQVRGVWKAVAAALPHRTIKAVAACGLRLVHPDARKGPWTQTEDDRLRELVESKGAQWAEIATEMERTRLAVRDRWKEIKIGPQKARGYWTVDEEQRLAEAVDAYMLSRSRQTAATAPGIALSDTAANGIKSTNAVPSPQSGGPSEVRDRRVVLDDIDWGPISVRVGTRSATQCKDKWYSQLSPSMVARGDWGPGDDRRMLRSLWTMQATAEHEVAWDRVVTGRTAAQARRRWRLMLKAVPQNRDKEFPEVLDWLVETYMPRLKQPKGQSASGT